VVIIADVLLGELVLAALVVAAGVLDPQPAMRVLAATAASTAGRAEL